MKYTFKVHYDGTGYWTYCYELPEHAGTQGDTMDELKLMIDDWLECVLDKKVKPEDIKILSEICYCPEDIDEHFEEIERERAQHHFSSLVENVKASPEQKGLRPAEDIYG